MGLNRILMKANGSIIEGDGEFIMTMGGKVLNMAFLATMLLSAKLKATCNTMAKPLLL